MLTRRRSRRADKLTFDAWLHQASNVACAGEGFSVQDQGSYPVAEGGEAFVCGLAVLVAGVDLLQDASQFEVSEDDVPVHLGEVAAALLGVAVDQFFSGHEASRYRYGGHDGLQFV